MPLVLLSLAIVVLDQALKALALRFLAPQQSIPLIKNFFHITLVQNTGAAFGILKGETRLFIVFSILSIAFVIYFLPKFKRLDAFNRIAFSLILGGALSNLLDRLRFGYVVDFLDFRIWPVFNVGDSAITIGALLLIVELLRKKRVDTDSHRF